MSFTDLFGGAERKQERYAKQSEQRQADLQRELQNKKQLSEQSYADDQTYLHAQDVKSDLIRWQQDFENDVDELKYRFLGYTKRDGEWKTDNQTKPVCNHQFIEQVMDPLTRFYLSRQFSNSNLSDIRLNDMLKRTFNNLAKTLILKHNKYSIEFEDFDDIDRELKVLIVPAAFRALNGWTKKTDSTMIKRIEALHEGLEREQKKKFFGLVG